MRSLSATLIANQNSVTRVLAKIVLTYTADDWAASTAYVVGNRVKPTSDNGYVYRCTTAGTSHSSEPASWGTTIGGTTSEGGGTVVWTCIGLASQTYGISTTNRIKDIVTVGEDDSQTAEVLIDNSDNNLTFLDLKGYQGIVSYGCNDTSAGDEYSARPKLWVMRQVLQSWQGGNVCRLFLAGVPSLLAEDHASADYKHDKSDAKTVKDLLTEVLDGAAVTSTLEFSQTTEDDTVDLDGTNVGAGQKRYIDNLTVKSVSFRIKKTGSPAAGNVIFFIRSTADNSILAQVTHSTAPNTDYTTSEVWYKGTFASPVIIKDEVYIYVDYSGGTVTDYISVAVNSSDTVSNEYGMILDTVGGYIDYPDTDCAYKFEYNSAGVTVFSHCTSITATFDDEDSLIDTYLPKDAFVINKGETRLSVVKRLLDYTSQEMRAEADGAMHFIEPTVSGSTYDSEYSLSGTDQRFLSKATEKALVVPNYIEVKTFPDDDTEYSGSATDAESNAIRDIRDYKEMKLVSDAQGASIASAMIARIKLSSQQGSALTHMNVGSEVHDYIKITDSRLSSQELIGNISYLKTHYTPTKFTMEVRMGKLGRNAVAGTRPRTLPSGSSNASVTWEDLNSMLDLYDTLDFKLTEDTDRIKRRLEWLEGEYLTGEYVGNLIYTKEQIDYLLSDRYYTAAEVDALGTGDTVTWLATSIQLVTQNNKSTDISWTDVDVTANTSASTKAVILELRLDLDSIGTNATDYAWLKVRKNGDTPTYTPSLIVGYAAGHRAGSATMAVVIVGVDSDEIFEYMLDIGGTCQADADINLLGYID